jgi:hypothetical protein
VGSSCLFGPRHGWFVSVQFAAIAPLPSRSLGSAQKKKGHKMYRPTLLGLTSFVQDTVKAVMDPLFKPVLQIVTASHGPLDHCLNFMQQKLDPQDVSTNGSHLARLVKGKAADIMNEFEALAATDTAWLKDRAAHCEFIRAALSA